LRAGSWSINVPAGGWAKNKRRAILAPIETLLLRFMNERVVEGARLEYVNTRATFQLGKVNCHKHRIRRRARGLKPGG